MGYQSPSGRTLAPLDYSPSGASGLSQPSNEVPQRPKRIACKECRQAKLRCDGRFNGTGNPCVRCRRLSLPCQIDTSYKRVNKRLKINELAEEVERLRSAVDSRERDALNTSTFISSPLPHCDVNVSHQQAAISQPPVLSQDHSTSSGVTLSTITPYSLPPADHSQTLEHINLNKDRISDLFRIFFQRYHPFFDILEPATSPDEYHSRSPLLFWSIVVIAAREDPSDATLSPDLSPCVKKLMWAAISRLPHTPFIIQAILLLSVWSFPTNSMSTDPSFILVSIAKSASMHLGLHRPETIQDFLRVKTRLSSSEFQEAVRTWVGGFIAAQSVTTSIGQSTVLYPDWVIDAACKTDSIYTIPQNLRHHLLISKFVTRVNNLMAEDKHSETGYPLDRDICVLLSVLEQDFIDLKLHIGLEISETHEILLTMASLQLSTYYFFVSTDRDIRRGGLLGAYTTSLNLITKAIAANEKSNMIKYAPDSYSRFLVLGAVLVMKIIHSSYCKYVNHEEGKVAFGNLIRMLRQSSVENDDIRGRASKILTQLWNFHQSRTNSTQEEPRLNLKTRLGASLLHDSLWTWREEFGGQRDALGAPASTYLPLYDSQPQDTTGSNIKSTHQERLGSRRHPDQHLNSTAPTPLEDFNLDNADMNWLWDVGFPSFLPMDFNSYDAQQPGFQ